jgi:hypothetical protein
MESKLARQVEQALIDDVKGMTHEQRLEAFITHSRLMMELYLAGEEHRESLRGRSA